MVEKKRACRARLKAEGILADATPILIAEAGRQCDLTEVNVHGRYVQPCRKDARWRLDGDEFCDDHIGEYVEAYLNEKTVK